MHSEGTDRRRYPRSKRGLPIVVDESGPGVLNHVDNISTNGVLCHTIKPIPLMTKLSIALVVPRSDNHRVECEGIVVRCDPHESGDDHFKVAILFADLSPEDKRVIAEFVEYDLNAHPHRNDNSD